MLYQKRFLEKEELKMIVVESLGHINVIARDIKKSIEFYTLFLDFELLEETEKYAFLAFDELRLKLNLNTSEEKNFSEGDSTPLSIFAFVMDVDDFTDAIQIAEKEKVPIISGPSELESGEGEFIVLKDPGGNLIELFYQE